MDLALNNLQRLICYKTQTTNQQQVYVGYVVSSLVVLNNTLFIKNKNQVLFGFKSVDHKY